MAKRLILVGHRLLTCTTTQSVTQQHLRKANPLPAWSPAHLAGPPFSADYAADGPPKPTRSKQPTNKSKTYSTAKTAGALDVAYTCHPTFALHGLDEHMIAITEIKQNTMVQVQWETFNSRDYPQIVCPLPASQYYVEAHYICMVHDQTTKQRLFYVEFEQLDLALYLTEEWVNLYGRYRQLPGRSLLAVPPLPPDSLPKHSTIDTITEALAQYGYNKLLQPVLYGTTKGPDVQGVGTLNINGFHPLFDLPLFLWCFQELSLGVLCLQDTRHTKGTLRMARDQLGAALDGGLICATKKNDAAAVAWPCSDSVFT